VAEVGPGPNESHKKWTPLATAAFCAALTIACVAVFAGVVSNGFIRFDDPRYVTQNEVVLQGLTADGTTWAFTTFFKSNWHPITWLSHMLDVELFGIEASGHHATNLLLHALNALLLFFVLRAATRAAGPSALVAVLFAVHPTHVESVAWIAERKDVLSTLFGLLAMVCFVGYARSGGVLRYAGMLLALTLGLASKASLVTLPFLFLLLDYWPLRRFRERGVGRLCAEKLPLLAIAAVFSVLTMQAQAGGGATEMGSGLALTERAANAVMSYGLYIWKTFWPTDLSILYPHPYLAGGTPYEDWQVGAVAVGLSLVTLFCVAMRSRPYLAVGWLWFGGTLVPMIGLVQAGSQAFADRYTYVSCIGLYLIVAFGGADLLRGVNRKSRALGAFGFGAFVGCLALLGATAQQQVGRWRDTETLFEHSLSIEPGAVALQNNLGNELYERGDVEESIAYHRRAVELMPEIRTYQRNLSRGLRATGEVFEAELHGLLARGIEIDSVEGQSALAMVRMQERDFESAHGHLEYALEIDPGNGNALTGMAFVLQSLGDVGAARELLENGLSTSTDTAPVALALAQLQVSAGEPAAALESLRIAASSGALSTAHQMLLARGFVAVGEVDAAAEQLRGAIEASPGKSEPYVLLGDTLMLRGNAADAIIYYRQAIILTPESESIRSRLSAALGGVQSAPSDSGPR
jgi:Tfp pilus assembly protein PilF